MQRVQTPIIPEVAQLIAAYPGAISLGQGMVAFPPPAAAKEALDGRWHDAESHRYGPVEGEPALLDALRRKLRRDNGIAVDERHWLAVCAGSNMAFLQAVLTITDPGDDVVLLTPYYFNHQMALGIAGCRSVEVATDGRYQPRVDAVAAAIGPRTRAVVTVSPNNPTGAVYDETTLRQINDLCRQRGIYHLHDEAYEYFLWDDAEHVSPGAFEHAAEHTVSFYSFSKAYGMAGWRMGYALMPSGLRSAWLKVQDTNLICPPRWSQWAAVGALTAGSAYCRRQLQPLVAVRRRLLAGLESLGDRLRQEPVRSRATARGAMYAWLEIPPAVAGGRTGREINEALVRRFGVAALPGETFGMEGKTTLRISFGALEPQVAEEGVSRLVRGLESLLQASSGTSTVP